ncbi:MAG: S8 family serine peptidase [Cyanobacteriota bacterium]|nr:S8 family serine peptidase [Cyanobacteriota bacterium]
MSPRTFGIEEWFAVTADRRSDAEAGVAPMGAGDGLLAPVGSSDSVADAPPAVETPGDQPAPATLSPTRAWSAVLPGADGGVARASTAPAAATAVDAPAPSSSGVPAAATPASVPPVALGERLLVQWAADATEAERAAALRILDGVRMEVILTAPMRARGEGVMEVIQLPAGANVPAALAIANAIPGVRFAEVDQLLQTQAISNDIYYRSGLLWGMYGSDSPTVAGAVGTTNPFGSNAEAAWNQGFTGSKSVLVGILDEGIDYEHEDLSANVWVNPYELEDGIDNDGNGYVDDVRGWNFFDNTNITLDRNYDDHGTHVAGTIGAVGGNGIGVAGVNWDVTMIASKFMGPSGGFISDAIMALDYVTDLKWRHNLNIIATNNSWIGGGNSQAMREAIVRSARQDILFVVSAGNESSNNDIIPSYPSGFSTASDVGYDAVISVAAISSNGQLASYSSYGRATVDLGAPGDNVFSTLPWDDYSWLSGSSMAAPHVTGAIALYASLHPGCTAEQIRSALLASVTPTASLAGITASGGRLDVATFLNTTVPPAFSIASAQPYLAEGQSGVTPFVFKLTRHGNTTGQATVSWNVAGAGPNPVDGEDFVGPGLPSGTATFAPGETSQTITVLVASDTRQESSEDFIVSLRNPSDGGTLAAARSSATARILNDDGVILAFDSAAITIPSFGSALPFPSTLSVSSDSANVVSSVEVTLYNFYHNSLDDLDLLLVGPTGAKTLLMSDAGGANPVDGITLTFSAQAAAPVPDHDPLSTGSWLPMNHFSEDDFDLPPNDLFDSLAPAGPYVADLSVFNGTNPTGDWKLFVKDDATDAAGKIIDGWSLTIHTQPTKPSVSLAVSPDRVMEDGQPNLIYTFTRTGPAQNPLTVNYTVAGTATLDSDYTGIATPGPTKEVTFASGATTATVIVNPRTDTEVEGHETVALTLVESPAYSLGTVGAVVGTIQDDDTQLLEGGGGIRLLRDLGSRLFVQAGNGNPIGLRFRGRPITQSGFPGWEPLAAETFAGVNQMIWKNIAGNYLSLWTMDSHWNWISSTGEWGLNSPGAMLQEVNFGHDFNGNSLIGSSLS